MSIILGMYLYVAFWTALIAARCADAPRAQMPLVIGSIFLGLIWPFSLPMHLTDLPERLP